MSITSPLCANEFRPVCSSMQCFLFQDSWFLGMSLFESVRLLSKCLFVFLSLSWSIHMIMCFLCQPSFGEGLHDRTWLDWSVWDRGTGGWGRHAKTRKPSILICAIFLKSVLILGIFLILGHFLPILGTYTLIWVFLWANFLVLIFAFF